VVEFEYPSPNGRHFRLHLVDVSSSGISFAVPPEESLAVEPGASIDGATIRIGNCMIQGDLVVMHLSQDVGTEPVCGALLYPGNDTDLVKLKSVVAGMEAVKR